jgi:serine/threonine protein kinase
VYFVVVNDVPYREYRCSHNDPLKCDQPQKTLQEYKGSKFCLECGFPTPLVTGQEIKGRRGTYQIKQCVGARGWGRLYKGVRLNDGQPIFVKEYLLLGLNAETAQRRKDTFVRVAGLTPADGRIQDFRLLPMEEAIASHQDDRCYLISAIKDLPLPLQQYLAQRGTMTALQVRDLLNQTLQTLQFLHSQKFRRPSGQMDKGITHGNLNLDSVLWTENTGSSNDPFYIYLSDLADWEFLFHPDASSLPPAQPAQDLMALGQIALELWTGAADPRQAIGSDHDRPLTQFLQQLMGLEAPFASAEEARQVLLKLPRQEETSRLTGYAEPQSSKPKSWFWWCLGAFLLCLMGVGWYLLKPKPDSSDPFMAYRQLQKTFNEVSGIEENEYHYAREQEGTWSSVLNSKYLVPSLAKVLQEQKPKTQYLDKAFNSEGLGEDPRASAPIQAVQNGEVDFAISSLTEPLTDEQGTVPIAYDGLLVFVPFTKEVKSLPTSLNGKIRLEELRRLYIGDIKNWKELGGPDRVVQLRVPTDPEAVRMFQKLVLKDDKQAIARFKSLVTPQATQATLNENRDERNPADADSIISFGIFSKFTDQCGGYPLAIVGEDGIAAQALVLKSNGAPITPKDNICDKISRLDGNLLRQKGYPLEYDLNVVYPRDNSGENREKVARRFADLLTKTQQGQCLLNQAWLVPLQPVPDDCQNSL